jgi:hypothetical protein
MAFSSALVAVILGDLEQHSQQTSPFFGNSMADHFLSQKIPSQWGSHQVSRALPRK